MVNEEQKDISNNCIKNNKNMQPIKFADQIVSEIKSRGPVQLPENSCTGEEFENWLRNK